MKLKTRMLKQFREHRLRRKLEGMTVWVVSLPGRRKLKKALARLRSERPRTGFLYTQPEVIGIRSGGPLQFGVERP